MINITEFLVKKHIANVDDSISINDLKSWYVKSFKYKNVTFNLPTGHFSKTALRSLCIDNEQLVHLKNNALLKTLDILTDIINTNIICFFFTTVDSYKIKFILNDKDDYIQIFKINDSYQYNTSKSKKKRNYNEKTIKNEIQLMIN